VWFDEPADPGRVDAMCRMQAPAPVPGAACSEFHTIVVDLQAAEDDLLAAMTKDTRYEIRRAETKDGIVCSFAEPGPQSVSEFCAFYNGFAESKGLGRANDQRLQVIGAGGCLALSRAGTPDGQILVWHAYYRGGSRVRLLHSASQFRGTDDSGFRNMVGRANRLLHWKDMQHFKQAGVRAYDLGGWYAGEADEEKLRINQFKQEFGGQVVKEYNCLWDVTLKAKVVHAGARLLARLKGH
jgi:hypothetical protein